MSKQLNSFLFGLGLSVAGLMSWCAATQAADADAGTTTAASTAPAAGAADNGGKPLQGSVKAALLNTGKEIREMGTALRQLDHAATELYGEAVRQDMVTLSSPDVIGPGAMVIPAVPVGPIGLGPYLPMRKQWVDFCMAHMSQLLPLVDGELQDIGPTVPDTSKEGANSLLADTKQALADVQSHYDKLKALTEAPKYDNKAIGNECAAIHDAVKRMEKLRKQLWKVISQKS